MLGKKQNITHSLKSYRKCTIEMNELFENFDWKNGKLDNLQLSYLKRYADEKISKYLSTEPVNEKEAEKHITEAYRVANLSIPKNFIWYDSPKQFTASVGDSVGASVWASVWDSVWASVRDSVGDSVGASVRASVWASVGASVWASVWASVRDSVWDSVRASVRASVWSWQNPGYAQWLQFFSDHQEQNDFRHMCMFEEMTTGYLLTADTVHIVRKPTKLVTNQDGRLHYDHDKAIEWADGYGFYYLMGVEFDEKTFKKIVDKKFTMKDMADGKLNAQQRPVALSMLRPDRLLKQVNAKLIHTGIKGTELYEVKNFMDTGETEYCMLMTHPTLPKQQYIEWVHPEVGKKKDADLAQAEAFGMVKEDYLLAVEA